VDTAVILRILLLVDIFTLALVAAFFLRSRRLSWGQYLLWGLLAVCLPILGPFLVILRRPGR
jgi:hypothetical protein